jgi:hypothetical protein
MKYFNARLHAPLEVARPLGCRLLQAFSPKLARPIRLFDHASFEQWIRLEADPAVLSLCERPARLGPDHDARLIDFWVRRADSEELLLLEHGEIMQVLPDQIDGTALRVVALAELAAAHVWIANWQRMLPVINTTRALLPEGLSKSVLAFVRAPVTLSSIEHQLSIGDSSLVRGAIFELLRTGQLCAPALHTQPLSLQTLLEPVP